MWGHERSVLHPPQSFLKSQDLHWPKHWNRPLSIHDGTDLSASMMARLPVQCHFQFLSKSQANLLMLRQVTPSIFFVVCPCPLPASVYGLPSFLFVHSQAPSLFCRHCISSNRQARQHLNKKETVVSSISRKCKIDKSLVSRRIGPRFHHCNHPGHAFADSSPIPTAWEYLAHDCCNISPLLLMAAAAMGLLQLRLEACT